jgi:hypothetical protein
MPKKKKKMQTTDLLLGAQAHNLVTIDKPFKDERINNEATILMRTYI